MKSHSNIPVQFETVKSIGREDGRLLILDEAMPAPDQLVRIASDEIYVRAGAVYPGVRAPVPPSYLAEFRSIVAPLIKQAFGVPIDGHIDGCSFSIVTIPPCALAVNQRVPHTDANSSSSLAFIHYLCDPMHGGTSFFRHRATGYERITEQREREYNQQVAKDLQTRSNTSSFDYATDSDDHFERILTAENRFNRLLVYPGNNLHSGDIRQPEKLSANPRDGRLTVTGFLTLAS